MESPRENTQEPSTSKTITTGILSVLLFFSPGESQANTKTSQTAKLSVTAVAVAEAYSNAYFTLDKALSASLAIPEEEIAAQRTMLSAARSHLSGLNKLLFGSISHLPSTWEHTLLNAAVEQSYGYLILLRKLMIKQQIDKAIADGTQQIVFLAGGLDIRGLYTAHNHPQINVFELDTINMQQIKREGLQHLLKNADTPANLHLVDGNVNGPWWYRLVLKAGFNETQKTLYIAEGLTMYLSEEENKQFLRGIQERMKPEDSLLISFMSQIKTNAVIHSSMKAEQEHFGFGLEKINSVAFIKKQGLRPEAWFESSRHLHALGDIAGKTYFEQTERPQEYYLLLKRSDSTPELALDLFDFPQITLAFKGMNQKPTPPYQPFS